MTLALADRDELTLEVDIRNPQVDEFGNPQPSGINSHQDGAVLEVRRVLEECGDLGRAQDHRQLLLVAGIRNMFDHPLAMQDVMVEKTQRAYGLVERRPRELFPLDQEELVLAHVFRSESIWRGFKVLGKVGHTPDVCTLRMG